MAPATIGIASTFIPKLLEILEEARWQCQLSEVEYRAILCSIQVPAGQSLVRKEISVQARESAAVIGGRAAS